MALTLEDVQTYIPELKDKSPNEIISLFKEKGLDTSALMPDEETGLLRNYVGIPLLKGAGGVGSSIGYGLEASGIAPETGRTIQESGEELSRTLTRRQSQQAQEDAQKRLIDEEGNYGGYNAGTFAQQLSESLPAMSTMAVPGTVAARAIEGGLKVAGAGKAAGLLANAVGYGASEGVVSGASSAAQIQQEIRNTDIETLSKHPAFIKTIEEETDPSLPIQDREIAARELLARKAGDQVFVDTTIKTGGIGMLTGGGMPGMLRSGAAGNIGQRIVTGITKEGVLQEAPQSALEQRTVNQAKKDYLNPNQDVNEGVLTSGLEGGLVGTAMGGVGGIAKARSVDEAIQASDQALQNDVPPSTELNVDPINESLNRAKSQRAQQLIDQLKARRDQLITGEQNAPVSLINQPIYRPFKPRPIGLPNEVSNDQETTQAQDQATQAGTELPVIGDTGRSGGIDDIGTGKLPGGLSESTQGEEQRTDLSSASGEVDELTDVATQTPTPDNAPQPPAPNKDPLAAGTVTPSAPEKAVDAGTVAVPTIDYNDAINGKISIAEFGKKLGLTESEIDDEIIVKRSIQKPKTQYSELMNEVRAEIEKKIASIKKPTNQAASVQKTYQNTVSHWKRSLDTLASAERDFLNPFGTEAERSKIYQTLQPSLKNKFAKRFEAIPIGDQARKEQYKAKAKVDADALLSVYKNKQLLSEQTQEAFNVPKQNGSLGEIYSESAARTDEKTIQVEKEKVTNVKKTRETEKAPQGKETAAEATESMSDRGVRLIKELDAIYPKHTSSSTMLGNKEIFRNKVIDHLSKEFSRDKKSIALIVNESFKNGYVDESPDNRKRLSTLRSLLQQLAKQHIFEDSTQKAAEAAVTPKEYPGFTKDELNEIEAKRSEIKDINGWARGRFGADRIKGMDFSVAPDIKDESKPKEAKATKQPAQKTPESSQVADDVSKKGEKVDKKLSQNTPANTQKTPYTPVTLKTYLTKTYKSMKALIDNGTVQIHERYEDVPDDVVYSGDMLVRKNSVVAFHGSPHDHNKFDSSKIGTGEGAQAFGFGIYFTDKKEIAEYYRKSITQIQDITIPQNFDENFFEDFDVPMSDVRKSIRDLYANEASKPGYLKDVSDNESYIGRLAKAIIDGKISRNEGKLYQVELAPEQDELLDWDSSLQTQGVILEKLINSALFKSGPNGIVGDSKFDGNVIKGVAEYAKRFSFFDAPTKNKVANSMIMIAKDRKVFDSVIKSIPVDMMDMLSAQKLTPDMLFHNKSMLIDFLSSNSDSPIASRGNMASTLISVMTIKGAESISDNTRRAANNLFSTIVTADISHKKGSDIYNELSTRLGQKATSDYLHSLGIRGIRYKAEQGKSDAYNYVIFSDDDISIKEKFSKETTKNVEGFYYKGTVHLIAENLNESNVDSVLHHEFFHKSVDENPKLKGRLLGAQSELRKIMEQVEAGTYKGRYKEIYDKAMSRLKKANPTEAEKLEEFLAYSVSIYNENPKNLPERLARIIKDLIAAIKMAIFKATGKIVRISPADLTAMARSSMNVSNNSSGSDAVMRASAFAPDTIKPDYKGEFFHGDQDKNKVIQQGSQVIIKNPTRARAFKLASEDTFGELRGVFDNTTGNFYIAKASPSLHTWMIYAANLSENGDYDKLVIPEKSIYGYPRNIFSDDVPESNDIRYSISDDIKDFITGTPRTVNSLSDIDTILQTGKMPQKKSDLQSVLDKAATLLVDSTRPFDVLMRKMPNIELASRVVRDKDLAKRKVAVKEKEALDTFLKPLAKIVNQVSKDIKFDYRATHQIMGEWLTVRYALEKNQDYIRQDQDAVDQAQEALNDDPENKQLKAALTRAKNAQKERLDAINEQKWIDPRNEKLQAKLAGGYNNFTAQEQMDKYEKAIPKDNLEEAARIVYAMNKWKTELDLSTGKVTQDQVDQWFKSPYYVPLTGDASVDVSEDELFAHGGVNQQADKRAIGRSGSIAQNGIDASVEQVQKSARYYGWGDFKDSLYNLYEGLIQEELDAGATMREAQDAVMKNYQISRSPLREGFLPDTGIVYRKGKEKWVFDLHNQEAVDALKSINKEEIPSLLQPVANFTRGYSRFVTQLMPGFGFINAIRDTWERSENIRARTLPGYETLNMDKVARDAIKNASHPSVIKKLMAIMLEGTGLEGKIAIDENDADIKTIREMIKAGTTSTVGDYLAQTNKDLTKQMKDSLSLSAKGWEYVSAWNNAFELVSTYSLYKSLKDNGVDTKTAAAGVLNLMNFGKSGTITGPLRALYVFTNPIFQGGNQLIRTLSTRRGQIRAGAYLLAGMALYGMLRAIDGDDDELGENKMDNQSNFMLERNIHIPFGDGTYLKIPIGFGMPQAMWSAAINLDKMIFGKQDVAETAVEIAKSFSRTLAPVAPSEASIIDHPIIWMTQTLTPQIIKPVMNIGLDANMFGQPLTNTRFARNDKALALQGRKSTPEAYKEIALELGKMGINVYPEQVREIVRGYAVGPMNEVIKAWVENPHKESLGRKTVSILVDRFVSVHDSSGLKERLYYRYRDEMNRTAVKQSLGKELSQEENKLFKLHGIVKKLEAKANGKLAAATKAEKKRPGFKSPYRKEGENIRESAMNLTIKSMSR